MGRRPKPNPTPQEIEERKLEIQRNWTPRQRKIREIKKTWTLPVVHVDNELLEYIEQFSDEDLHE